MSASKVDQPVAGPGSDADGSLPMEDHTSMHCAVKTWEANALDRLYHPVKMNDETRGSAVLHLPLHR